jgi:DNA-directed RNA polymerase subunit alpha
MLQVKQLRLILQDVDTAHLHLDVRGEGTVTAADIQAPAEVEIVNPELYLFTVDDPNTRLEIDMTVERGEDIHRRLNAVVVYPSASCRWMPFLALSAG